MARTGRFPQLIAFVESKAFTRFIIATILVAAVLVGMETSPGTMERWGGVIHALDKIVLWIFAAEAALKIISYLPRPLEYFKDPWNVFDFAIVAICFLPFDAQYVAVLRLARVLRVLRLLTVVPRLQLLVGALLKSIPSMFYVSILLFILFYIYGVLGTMLFGGNDPKHYGTLGDSLLSLFRVVTLEDWTDIMYINMYGSDQYGYEAAEFAKYPGIEHKASPLGAVFFHVSFVLFGTMVMLNLFIGVIMTGMQEAQDETERLARGEDEAVSDEDKIRDLEEQVSELGKKLRELRIGGGGSK